MLSVARRKLNAAAAITILALMGTMGVATPALAHESISDQFPVTGSTVEAGWIDLRLEFTGDLLVLADASAIELEITDPDGDKVRLGERGCLVIGKRSLQSSVELDETGEYLVNWQVTAGDGHPLSEGFTFRIENSSGFTASTALAQLSCSGNVLPDGSVVSSAADSGSGGTSGDGNVLGFSTNVWLAGLLAVALALIAALSYLLLKPGSSRANRN